MAVVVINIPKQNQQQLQNMSPNSIPSKRRKSSGNMYTQTWYHDEGIRTIPDRANYCRYTRRGNDLLFSFQGESFR